MTKVNRERFDTIDDKLSRITEWMDEHPEFDPSYIESLVIQFRDKENLSDKQIESLNNIIEKWDIE